MTTSSGEAPRCVALPAGTYPNPDNHLGSAVNAFYIRITVGTR